MSRVADPHRWFRWIALATALVAAPAVGGKANAAGPSPRIVPAHPTPAGRGRLDPVARRALRQGYLVPNQRAYQRAKADAARRRARASALAVRPPLSGAARRLAPQVERSWTGGATPSRRRTRPARSAPRASSSSSTPPSRSTTRA